jgi:hypothetical protein
MWLCVVERRIGTNVPEEHADRNFRTQDAICMPDYNSSQNFLLIFMFQRADWAVKTSGNVYNVR